MNENDTERKKQYSPPSHGIRQLFPERIQVTAAQTCVGRPKLSPSLFQDPPNFLVKHIFFF